MSILNRIEKKFNLTDIEKIIEKIIIESFSHEREKIELFFIR